MLLLWQLDNTARICSCLFLCLRLLGIIVCGNVSLGFKTAYEMERMAGQ